MRQEQRESHMPDAYKYWAFISYSHQDEQWARWLHRKLERYRVPKRLVGKALGKGTVPRRIFPVFRDREELPGASDLGEKINAALRSSRYMVVICSPNAAVSRWVNEEIKQFKALGRDDRVFSLIIDGEPWASERPASGLLECFPEAIRFKVGKDGRVTEERSEALAADARPGKDGKPNSLFKLFAGILDVNYDDLKQRERRRRFWTRLQLAVAAFVLLALVFGIWYKGHIEVVAAEKAKNMRFSQLMIKKAKEAVENRNNGTAIFYGAHVIKRRLLAEAELDRRESDFLSSLSVEALLGLSIDHNGTPLCVALSPKGAILVSGAEEGTITIWEVGDPKPVTSFTGHKEGVTSITFGPKGKQFATGGADGSVALWNAVTYKSEGILGRHQGAVSSLSFSPDGRFLAAAGHDATITLWSLESAEKVVSFAHEARVNSIAFGPKGRILASASDDRTLRLWDVVDFRPLRLLQRYPEPVRSVAISPDGKRLAAGSWDTTIKLWDLTSFSEIAVLDGHGKSVDTVSFSPAGSLLASGSRDETIKLWDIGSMDEITTLRGHRHYVTSIAFSADGATLVTASLDQIIKLWRVMPRKNSAVLTGHSSTIRSVVFSPDGKLLASAGDDHTIRLWDVASRASIRQFLTDRDEAAHTDAVRSLAFGPGGKFLVSGGRDRQLKLWIVAEGKEVNRKKDAHDHWIFAVAVSPDGSRIASASYDGEVKIWAAPSLQELHRLDAHGKKPVGGVVFSPDGKLLATASDDMTAKLWSVASGELINTLSGHDHAVRGIAFSHDGSQLATASADSQIKIWDAKSGNEVDTLLGHHSLMVWTVAFSPDGLFLASGSHSNDRHTLRLWHFESRRVIEWLTGHREFVVTTAFSPNGQLLASGGTDKTIRLWRVADFWPKGKTGRGDDSGALLRRFVARGSYNLKSTEKLIERVARLTNLELVGSDALPIANPDLERTRQ